MKFLIRPGELKLDNRLLINDTVLKILSDKNIKLILNIYDSHPDCPDKNKQAVVFIHGNHASMKVFQEQIKYFEKNYRVVAFDMLGHDQSTNISNIDALTESEKELVASALYNPMAMIAQTIQLLEEIGTVNAHLIAWALGGCIAYGVAIDSPNLVSSVTTIGTPPIRFGTEGFKKGCNEWFTNVLIPKWVNHPAKYTLQESKEIAARVGFSDVEGSDKYFIENMLISDPLMRKYFFQNMDQYESKALDGEKFVKSSHLPICLMVGEEDKGMNARYIATFSDQFKHATSQVHVIKKATNAVFRTNPEEFLEKTERFIASVKAKKTKQQWSTGQKAVFCTVGLLTVGVCLLGLFRRKEQDPSNTISALPRLK